MKRDSDYYKGRLKREYPAIYAELKAGRIVSVRQAAIQAKLVKPSSRVGALKREWRRATGAERKEFLLWAKGSAAASKGVRTTGKSIAIVDASGRLKPMVVDFLNGWLKDHKRRPGNILREIGFKNFDSRLAEALQGEPLPHEITVQLPAWLTKNGLRI